MKQFLCALVLVFCASGYIHAEPIVEQAAKGNEKADISYAVGMALGSDLKDAGFPFNYGSFLRGFIDTMEGWETRYTLDEAMEKVQAAFQAAYLEKAEASRLVEEAFLAENAAKPGMLSTASGLQYEILVEGTGARPSQTDSVRVNYTGELVDGTMFDSSYARGEPEEFPLEGVIPGWSEGLLLMKTGGKSRFYIPSKLAYGDRGAGSIIPPYSTLVFEVELLEILSPVEEDNSGWEETEE
jgi:FKBP-type peptidyl-prolyl cis-trans isomerase FkpA